MASIYQPGTHSLAQPAPGSRGPQTRGGPWWSVPWYRVLRAPSLPTPPTLQNSNRSHWNHLHGQSLPGHSPPRTAARTLPQAFPVSASRLLGHRWLLPEPQPPPIQPRREGSVLRAAATSGVPPGETPTRGQGPHWTQNTAAHQGKLSCSIREATGSRDSQRKLGRGGLQ